MHSGLWLLFMASLEKKKEQQRVGWGESEDEA